ncbi:hypothetical protein EVAR_103976_1 [Eumeta japonica]|uniref:Uncharacterized protein n=1 Tax=Eumeta variegata TaxID=151549 RepID=A0A4C1XWU2_EUMVA|nr:hypothetical protein EVAR_103976_1 [Eumeta japonica]
MHAHSNASLISNHVRDSVRAIEALHCKAEKPSALASVNMFQALQELCRLRCFAWTMSDSRRQYRLKPPFLQPLIPAETAVRRYFAWRGSSYRSSFW